MTAWIAVVVPMCLLAKCSVDFIVLEYGGRFQFVTDWQLLCACILMCLYALVIDFGNVVKVVRRR